MKKFLTASLLMAALTSLLTVGAQAADYSFQTDQTPDYYASTNYEEVYGSEYNYGRPNKVDYELPELLYGNLSTTQTGVMEKALLPGLQETVGGGIAVDGPYGTAAGVTLPPSVSVDSPAPALPPISIPAFTKLTSGFYLSNGAVGRLSIPALGISRYNVWEGETTSSMNKGVAHFSSTSVWDGNVCICGHNRGAAYNIGRIKNLDTGDKITYTTSQGTRTYQVKTVITISNNDWSYLNSTTDNRITLITCVAGDPSRRYCVQAVEAG